MRPLEDILADMQAIIDKPSLTADDVVAYQTLEAELAGAQAAGEAEPTPAGETDGEDVTPETDAVNAADATRSAVTQRAAAAVRARHASYTRVVVPAGRPANRARTAAETEMDGFRAYLRTGKPNADLTRSNAQTTGTGSSGGYTVPEEFLTRLVEVIKSYGGVLRNVETITTQDGRPLSFPSIDDTANTAAQAAENVAPASAGADLVFGEVALGAYEFNATGTGNNPLAVPRALVQDSAFNIEDMVAKKLGERIGRKMADQAVNGTNSTTPQGLLQGITGLELAQSSGVKYADLVDLTMLLDEAYWENAKWYMARASLGSLLKIVDGDSSLIFKPGQAMIGNGGTSVMGSLQVGGILAPVVLDSAMPAITLTNGAAINWGVFGDISEGYIWRMVRDVEVLVDPYTGNAKRQIQYNAWARADGKQKNTSAYKCLAGWTT